MISVVIPTRGRVRKLERALASVSAQTDKDFEILVVDDCSPADEASELAKLVERTPKASLIRNDTNMGAPHSRNRAVAHAAGSIIATLDSDDWWEPERLARHRDALAKGRAVLSFNPAWMVDHNEGGKRRLVCNSPPPVAERPNLALACWNFLGGCSSVCMDRERFEAVGGFDENLPSCQDWDLWYRMGSATGRIAFVDAPLTFQDWGMHERISTTRDKVDAGHDRLFSVIASGSWSRSEWRYISAHHRRVRARLEKEFGNEWLAVRMVGQSLAIRPTRQGFGDLVSFGRSFIGSLLAPNR